MSDNIERSLGRIEGKIEAMGNTVMNVASDIQAIKVGQAEVSQTVDVHIKKISTAEEKIEGLTASKNRLYGWAAGAGVVGAGLLKLFTWMAGKAGSV